MGQSAKLAVARVADDECACYKLASERYGDQRQGWLVRPSRDGLDQPLASGDAGRRVEARAGFSVTVLSKPLRRPQITGRANS
jgi:hypothetical protein